MTSFKYVLTVCRVVETHRVDAHMDHDECVVVEDNPHDQRAGAEKQVKMRVERKMSVDEEGMTFFSYQMNTLVPDTRYRYSLTYSYDGRYAKLAPWASFMTVALTAPDRPPRKPLSSVVKRAQ